MHVIFLNYGPNYISILDETENRIYLTIRKVNIIIFPSNNGHVAVVINPSNNAI